MTRSDGVNQRLDTTRPAPVASESSRTARRVWDKAYDEHPFLAGDFAWTTVTTVLEQYPGERVYEVGFGSGMNLRWAMEHGWQVAGCDVARTPYEKARAALPGADLRQESIVDCTAPSDHFDVVLDRAAMSYLSPKDIKKGVGHVRRILKTGGVFLFNPYGREHNKTFPEYAPDPTYYDMTTARRLFPDTKWELLDMEDRKLRDPEGQLEHTMRVLVRKIA